jgi:hypothetical protein
MGSNRLYDVEVEVRVDGVWYPGWLDPEFWRKAPDGRWEGYVRWSRGPAENRLDHFAEDDIRKV